MNRNSLAPGDISNSFAYIGHLIERLDVTLTTHGTFYLGLLIGYEGVHETNGDLTIN